MARTSEPVSAAPTDEAPTRRSSRSRLSAWEQAGRYVPAFIIGFFGFVFLFDGADITDPAFNRKVWLDVALGVAGLVALHWRRRFPLHVAVGLSLALAVSETATGAWVIAVVSLATRRKWFPSVLVLMVSVAVASWSAWRLGSTSAVEDEFPWWATTIFVGLFNALLIAVGLYVGARRDLLDSLRERAETAEREQALRIGQARAAERATIAREMHDVLAHRISLVAMHAGALAYRADLTDEQRTAEAHLIQENAHRALSDLRDVLGVLRAHAAAPAAGAAAGADAAARAPEPPQPTLADVSELVAEARAAGEDVTLLLDVPNVDDVPVTVGRHAYRIVQECLTNARKHAPGAPVTVTVQGLRRHALTVEVTNPLVAAAQVETPVPSSGVGLLGLAERAELTGGDIVHGPTTDGRYAVRVHLPWSKEGGR